MAYRLVVIDEILPSAIGITSEKLRLIWASRVRCRRLCGYMFPADDFVSHKEGIVRRTYCEMRNYEGTGPGELAFGSIRRRCSFGRMYFVRRPLVDEYLTITPDFKFAADLFLETAGDYVGRAAK